MSYAVEWEPEATGTIRSLDVAVAELVLDGIDLLCEAPTQLSRRSDNMSRPEQVYTFVAEKIRISIYFKFSQDETTLHLTDISVTEVLP